MFAHCPTDAVIPSLTFTKAELVYVLSTLLTEVADTDNSTRIELVEIRHYLNQIQDRVALALSDGTIGRAMAHCSEEPIGETQNPERQPEVPSLADLKRRFPTLSEDEIREVLDKAREEQKRKAEDERKNAPPAPPSFIAGPMKVEQTEPTMQPILTPQEKKNMENSKKFAQMLGAF